MVFEFCVGGSAPPGSWVAAHRFFLVCVFILISPFDLSVLNKGARGDVRSRTDTRGVTHGKR